MKTKHKILLSKLGRRTSWEEELIERKQEYKTGRQVRLICSCKRGDLFLERDKSYRFENDCSPNLACFIIRKDMHDYGSGWPLDK